MDLDMQLFNEVANHESGSFRIRIMKRANETWAFVGRWYSEDIEIDDLEDLNNLIALLTKAREYFVKD